MAFSICITGAAGISLQIRNGWLTKIFEVDWHQLLQTEERENKKEEKTINDYDDYDDDDVRPEVRISNWLQITYHEHGFSSEELSCIHSLISLLQSLLPRCQILMPMARLEGVRLAVETWILPLDEERCGLEIFYPFAFSEYQKFIS